MGLGFLTPAFLIGTITLAIPIIIHLTNREKRDVVAFPSLMFLTKIPYRSVRRQKIKHWLLFLMRCLALLLLVMAFSRPFLDRPGRAVASLTGAREVVILVDRSYSMGYKDRWTRAVDAAHRAVDGVEPSERATLVFFSDRATAANQPTSDRARLHSLIDGTRLGFGTTRYGPALKLAKKLLEESKLPRKEVALITDFQRLGWEGHEEIVFPAGTKLSTVDLSDPETSNVAVTKVVLEREPLSGRERVVASARLTNKGEEAFEDLTVRLELGGRPLREKRIRLEPNSSATVAFEPFTLPEGVSRGTVRTANDSLPQDNAFHFVIWPGQSLSVLVLEGPGVRARRSLYLRRVLALGDRPSFRVDVKKAKALVRGDLNGRSVVFLNDAPPPGMTAGRLLREFVKAGGGVVVALGEASGAEGFKGAAGDLLPAPWGAPVDRSTDWGGTLAYIDYDHPVFELFSAPRSGDFSPAKFFRYRPLATSEGILARFDDGAVALAEKRMGEGRVLIWTSTLDTFWNDLALQPVFLPFVHQLVKHAAGYAEANAWHSVGQVLDLSRHLELANASAAVGGARESSASMTKLVAVAPSGEKSFLSPQEERRLVTLDEQGFYEFRYLDSRSAGPVSVAVNLDLSESDLSSLDPEEVAAAVSSREVESIQAVGDWTPEDQDRRQRVWWYLLVSALALLGIETFWSNRLSRLTR
jgi:hypothetical protein